MPGSNAEVDSRMLTMQKKLILASQSVQRRLLLETIGIPFEVLPADIDEKAIIHDDPRQRAVLVATAKANTVYERLSDGDVGTQYLIIAADTFGFKDGVFFEKPKDKAEAKRMLASLCEGPSVAITGFCSIDTQTGSTSSKWVETTMHFRPLSESEIEQYVSSNEVTMWSGGFSPAYHPGAALIERIEGSLTSFSHGLPMELVVPALREAGISL